MSETTESKQESPFGKNELRKPFFIAFIGAIILVAAFFLPYLSATPEHKEYLKSMKNLVDATLDMTYADAANISIFDCVKLYHSLGGTLGTVVVAVIGTVGVLSVLTLLFVLLKKPIASIFFDLLTLGAFYMLSWDFKDRGAIQNSYYNAGIAHYLYYIGAIIVFAGSIWILIIKLKKRRK